MKYKEIVRKLKSMKNPKNIKGMARYGIISKKSLILGVSIYVIRDMAKRIGKDHELAQQLWNSKIREARLIATYIEDPKKVTERQMEEWVRDIDCWDICDQVCSNVFDKTEFSYKKAFEWTKRKEEFIKRAGFVLMAALAVHDKKAKDKNFEKFFPIIKKNATDERNYVKKAVNWTLRQIGKRNLSLNKKAIKLAKEIQKIDSKTAKWIASDAIRELESEKIRKRIARQKG